MASSGVPLSTPIPMALYPTLATLLTTSGLAVTALFYVYEVTRSRQSRRLAEELGMGLAASLLLGFGLFFLLLWVGVYL